MIQWNKEFSEGTYVHLESNEKFLKGLKKYNYINIWIENLGEAEKEFYFAIKDNQTKDYWGQFTYKTKLASGLNKIWINLDRYVGERGSHRYKRKINKSKIREVFVVFNPEQSTTKEKIKLKQASFAQIEFPRLPKGARFFIFGEDLESHSARLVTSKTNYTKKLGYGFEQIKLWQNRDAKIAPKILSQSIGVHEASFSMDLPPGNYFFELIWDELGYWETPFWKNRRLYINSKPELIETRSSWSDYLEDHFYFERHLKEEPFEQLTSKLKPIIFKKKHKGGKISLRFEGDASAVSLNTLFVYPESISEKVKTFKQEMKRFNQTEFDQNYRFVEEKQNQPTSINVSDSLSQGDCGLSIGEKLIGESDRPTRIWICLKGLRGQKVKITGLDPQVRFRKSVSSYQALDLGHESYTYRPSFFKEGMISKVEENFQILEVEIPSKIEGEIKFEVLAGKSKKLVSTNIYRIPYIKNPLNLGLFGPLPIGPTYFEGQKKAFWINELKDKVISELKKTEISFVVDQFQPDFKYLPGNESFVLMQDKLYQKGFGDQNRYIYNSKFWKELFQGHYRNSAQTENEYVENLNLELKKFRATPLIYLYSDEATGYRNAIEYDYIEGRKLKNQFPNIEIGGFANPYDYKKAKKLYESWNYIYFSDLPSKNFIAEINQKYMEWGLYNLCAEIDANLMNCYGRVLYSLYRNGLRSMIEWHLNSSQNFPYFDLDGREADIAFLLTDKRGELHPTLRYRELQSGLLIFKKLLYLEQESSKGKLSARDSKWLGQAENQVKMPLKPGLKQINSQQLSKFYRELHSLISRTLKSR
ncbi:MAG: hypothetical protein CME65_07505 [Halobacteriovoraceae bacterium]|nr:hypothetical protein [Halobacteriovoraceae bacterium]|tara:strand:- start:5759 stop:8203 length:2445 start_codon:yes stop_codon:yes gene_type:complete